MLTRQVLFMIFAFIVSFAFTFATTPLVRRFAFKIGAIDIPKDNRRMHKKPTPRIGGLAIIFGFTVATLCFAQPSRQLYGTLAGAAIIAVMGVIDDCKNLPAKLKFVIQIIAALVVVFAGDIKIDVFTNPNFLSDNPYWVLPEWLSVTLTVIWIVFITNAVNFIDGLDGLAAGVSAIMSISLVFISIQGVFKSYAVISFAVPLLILGLPLFDALFAMIRRILRGQSPMTADRGHLHHRLVDMGFSQKQTVFILYAISGVLGITAVLLAESGVLRALLLVICVLILLLIGSMLGIMKLTLKKFPIKKVMRISRKG